MNTNRRSFLKGAALAGMPFILPSRIRAAATPPNSHVNMGFIGIGIQGRSLLTNFSGLGVKVVAVCDVDSTRAASALASVENFHKEQPDRGPVACRVYQDFREVLARKDIDAVCLATPDHWHAIITLAALEAGKDVYCEKPLTHNIHESITEMEAVGRHKRVLQTGSHLRSAGEFRVGCELVRNGAIGKPERVTSNFGGPPRRCDLPGEATEPGLDWNLWLGPAPVRPYNPVLSPRGVHNHYPEWRSYAEYGGGGVCDMGAHFLDIVQWGLGMDESGPVEVRPPEQENAQTGAMMRYENGVTVTQLTEGFDVHFFGTEGEVRITRGVFEMVRDGRTIKQWARAEREFLTDAKVRLYHSKAQAVDFLERVGDRKRPVASEIEGGRSAICCHLMNLAYLHRRKIRWDPRKLAFADPDADASWRSNPYRAPWNV